MIGVKVEHHTYESQASYTKSQQNGRLEPMEISNSESHPLKIPLPKVNNKYTLPSNLEWISV
jgi:hypothetical protein